MNSYYGPYQVGLPGTVILLAAIAGALLTGGYRSAQRPPFLNAWALFCWATASSGALLLLYGTIPARIVITAGYALLLLAWGFYWAGARQLRGARVPGWTPGVAPGLWLAACCAPAFRDSLSAGAVVPPVVVAILSWGGTAEIVMLRKPHYNQRSARALAMLTFAYGGAMAWYAGSTMLQRHDAVLAQDVASVLGTVIFSAIGFAGLAMAASQAADRGAAELAGARYAETLHAELERIFSLAPIGVFRGRLAPDGGFTRTYLSRGIEALTGWDWEDINPPGGLNGILDLDVTEREAVMRRLLETDSFVDKPRIRRRDGSWMWARVNLMVLDRQSDGSAELVGFIADHSVEREQEMRLVQAARMEALGQLASGMAHDFNNVLQAVDAGLTLASASLPDDAAAARKFLGLAAEATRHGTTVTGRLLSFSRHEPQQSGPVEAVPLLSDLVAFLRPAIRPDITLLVEAPPGLPPLLADRGQLEAVLINLVNNAKDAMPDGGNLTLRAEAALVPQTAGAPLELAAGRYIRLSVADSGQGIAPDVLARVCEPFFTTKPAGRGTGLGLAMARRFAEEAGGALAIASRPGFGTTVSLWLPEAAPAARGNPGAQPVPLARASADESPRLAILLAVDRPEVRMLLAAQLVERGCTVAQAETAAHAIALIDNKLRPDALVTDFALPGDLDGLGLVQAARLRLPRLPVVLITGQPGTLPPVRLREAGQQAPLVVLCKPVTAEMVITRLRALHTA